jgi:colicin import membrane protein
MARKLKTYLTSQGFFDLAIAAPSMKAALEAWGASSNLFHQGFAHEADDPKIIKATLAKPGVVLKRPVGTNEPFSEDAHLPTNLEKTGHQEPAKPRRQAKKPATRDVDEKEARKASLAYEQEEKRRERERRKEQAEVDKRLAKRERATATAQAAFDAGEKEHKAKVAAIEKERAQIDERAQAEEDRWTKLQERLRDALRKARD